MLTMNDVRVTYVLYYCVLLLAVWGVSACSKPLAVTIVNAYIYELPAGKPNGQIYLEIHNPLSDPLVVNYVHSEKAESIHVVRSVYDAGARVEYPVHHLKIGANKTKKLVPKGFYLSAQGLDMPLTVGDIFEITIAFENSQSATGKVKVRKRP